MKILTFKTYAVAAICTSFLFACGSSTNTETTMDVEESVSGTFAIDASQSNANWEAFKYVGSGHNGHLKINQSDITVENGTITSAIITIDMNTISVQDLTGNLEDSVKLTNHLKSKDFFMVDSIPTATFEMTRVDSTGVTGNLTIKGMTKEVTFPSSISINDSTITVIGEQTINRTDWGLTYNSKSFFENLADAYYIKDELKLGFKIVANKK